MFFIKSPGENARGKIKPKKKIMQPPKLRTSKLQYI